MASSTPILVLPDCILCVIPSTVIVFGLPMFIKGISVNCVAIVFSSDAEYSEETTTSCIVRVIGLLIETLALRASSFFLSAIHFSSFIWLFSPVNFGISKEALNHCIAQSPFVSGLPTSENLITFPDSSVITATCPLFSLDFQYSCVSNGKSVLSKSLTSNTVI